MKRFIGISLLVLATLAAPAQTKINPNQVNWPLITGSGTPTVTGAACTSIQYGMSYQNTAVTPNTRYHCAADGWELEGVTSFNTTTQAVATPGVDAIGSAAPYVDIRAYGALLDNYTPIDSALQAAINSYQYQRGHSATILLPCAGGNGSFTADNGCYLDNPSLLTQPSGFGANYKFIIQGNLRVGSTLIGQSWQNWYSDSGGFGNQFQAGAVPASIQGPVVNGTLGTAIPVIGTATTLTPTFTNGDIAHLPAGSAITIAGLTSSTATASRASVNYGAGVTVLTTASPIRIPPGEIITVTGCSDSSFDTTK